MTAENENINNASLTFPPPSTVILSNLVNQLLLDEYFYIETLQLARKFGYSSVYERKTVVHPRNHSLSGKVVWVPYLDEEVLLPEEDEHCSHISLNESVAKKPVWTKGRSAAYLRDGKESRRHSSRIVLEKKRKDLGKAIKININNESIKCLRKNLKPSDSINNAHDKAEYIVQTTDKEKHVAQLCHVKHSDYELFPIFKNYKEGLPTEKIYIKNLSKAVILEDLHALYQPFSIPDKDKTSNISIRFFNRGKLRRQAFITFPSIQLAAEACRNTNGTMLKGKPIHVVFARTDEAKSLN